MESQRYWAYGGDAGTLQNADEYPRYSSNPQVILSAVSSLVPRNLAIIPVGSNHHNSEAKLCGS
ncbi:hypothetical protein [Vibrio phage vB_VpaP_SJSY21]|nr:hypothetical protein [Vibrio phage vB_VpaP_SJSY21]